MEEYANRNEVPEEYKWDLTSFFKNEEEFNISYNKAKKIIEELKSYMYCTKNPKKLYEFLTKWIEAVALWEDLYVYSYLLNDQELGNSEHMARKSKTQLLYAELEQNTSFFAPELLKLSQKEYDALFLDEQMQEFKADLDKTYREKKHVLNENEEKILSQLTNASNHFADMSSTLINSEHDYGKVKIDDKYVTIATNNCNKLLKNKDERIRKKVYTAIRKKLDQYGVSSAMYLNGYVNTNNTLAIIHKYRDAWEEKLNSLNMSNQAFQALVNTTEENLEALHKYYQLKKKILDLNTLHIYDLNLDLEKNTRTYTISEAQEIVKNAIAPLGKEYAEKFDKIIKNRYIDYCQYKGKCSGGYSFSTILQDSRILMSFNGTLDSVSTIAHESGHNIHHQFIKENNPMQYRNSNPIVSEVCSLTNECLLSDYIYKNGKTKEEKLAGLSNIMAVIASNLFGAVREGKIEQEMYEQVKNGGTITKEYMNKMVEESLRKYYGKSVKLDKYAACSWITRSHYFMNFYLYSYAICVSVATYVAREILKGNKEMLERYLKFMKLGSDKWPTEAFEVLGINLEEKDIYINAISYFEELMEKYEKVSKEEV